MSKMAHVAKEVSRNIIRNPGTTFSAILSMTLLLLLFDIFWVAAGTSDKFYDNLLSGLQMEVFATEEVDEVGRQALLDTLGRLPTVEEVTFISKEDARAELSRLVGIDLLVGYDSLNPLPQSYLLSFVPGTISTDQLDSLESRINSLHGVSHAYYSRNWLEKAETTKAIMRDIGMMLGGLILLTVLFGSANNMRLTARTRAVGFRQMRLLGAGRLLLAMPFLIEGLVIGALSAAIGWIIIFYWNDRIEFTKLEIVLPRIEDILIYIALASLLGFTSGYLGIRKMLKL